jgi:hypothetical protein
VINAGIPADLLVVETCSYMHCKVPYNVNKAKGKCMEVVAYLVPLFKHLVSDLASESVILTQL